MKKTIEEFVSNPSFDEKIILSKDNSYPRISIVTPSRNQGRFLERTILSVLNQNYPNLEFLIIDGDSSDESVEIIKKYEKYLAYWVSEKDGGQSDGLNKGFKRATGEIVSWQSSDDLYLPGAFFKVADFFRKNPDIEVIYGNRFDIDQDDNIIGESIFTKFSKTVYQYDGISLGVQSVFWKKSLFSKIGYFDQELHLSMDYEFFLRAASKRCKFKFLPDYLGAMRRHEAAKTEKFLGTPPHQKELDQINKKYGRKKILNFPLKLYSLFFRGANYIIQGNGDYLYKGLKRRIKNKTILSGK